MYKKYASVYLSIFSFHFPESQSQSWLSKAGSARVKLESRVIAQ